MNGISDAALADQSVQKTEWVKMLVDNQFPEVNGCRVLLFVSSDEDAAAIALRLHEHDIATLVCHTPSELAIEIERGGAVVIVAHQCLSDDSHESLLHAVNDQRFRDVPLFVLADGSAGGTEDYVARLSKVGSVTRWTRSFQDPEFIEAIKKFVEAKRKAIESV